ncbi:hypothetical protein EAO77_00165, partial [Streptomyces sp. t39]
ADGPHPSRSPFTVTATGEAHTGRAARHGGPADETRPGRSGWTTTPAGGTHPGEDGSVTPTDAPHPEAGSGFTVTAAGPAASGAAAGAAAPAAAPVPLASAPLPAQPSVRGVATAGGLPVRPPGRTMAAADRGRPDPLPGAAPPAPARDAGAGFEAFARTVGARRRALGAGGSPEAYDATPAGGTYLPDGPAGAEPRPAPDAHPLPEPRTPQDPPGDP